MIRSQWSAGAVSMSLFLCHVSNRIFCSYVSAALHLPTSACLTWMPWRAAAAPISSPRGSKDSAACWRGGLSVRCGGDVSRDTTFS